MVPEMVWTRSRMGDNKGALYLIIDRLGDVNRVGHGSWSSGWWY
jgi:hypothetical protein